MTREYPCCEHCGGVGDPNRGTDDPTDGLPPGCADAPHDTPCRQAGCVQ